MSWVAKLDASCNHQKRNVFRTPVVTSWVSAAFPIFPSLGYYSTEHVRDKKPGVRKQKKRPWRPKAPSGSPLSQAYVSRNCISPKAVKKRFQQRQGCFLNVLTSSKSFKVSEQLRPYRVLQGDYGKYTTRPPSRPSSFVALARPSPTFRRKTYPLFAPLAPPNASPFERVRRV